MAKDNVPENNNSGQLPPTLESQYKELIYLGTTMCQVIDDLSNSVVGLARLKKRWEELAREIISESI